MLALILVLVLAALTAMHVADDDTVTLPDQGPWSEHGYVQTVGAVPVGALTPPRTTWAVPTRVPEPLAAVMPDSVLADGMSCTPGADRPVLDTVRPVLTARLTEPAPIEIELTKEDDTELLPFDRGLTASEDGHVALYLRRDSRLERSGSYRWRVRVEAGDWSPWCRFGVAATTPDSLGLDDASRTVGLPPSKWREISAVLDDPPRFRSIGGAGARVSAGDVGVDMATRDWETLLELMAERASAINDPELWRLVDTVSVKVGGPPHPTLGFPRA